MPVYPQSPFFICESIVLSGTIARPLFLVAAVAAAVSSAAALAGGPPRSMKTVGLAGCSASGKTTLVDALRAATVGARVICCDDYYRPKAECPTFALDELPWPGGEVPAAFAARGNFDMNHPASVDWDGVLDALRRARVAAGAEAGGAVVIVEGLLLLGDDAGAAAVRAEIDHFVLLDAGADAASQAALCARQFARAHLGKKSYKERGVSAAAYRCYWDHYVEPSWRTHGRERALVVCPDCARLDCRAEPDENVAKLLATGWFPSRPGKHRQEEPGGGDDEPSTKKPHTA